MRLLQPALSQSFTKRFAVLVISLSFISIGCSRSSRLAGGCN